MNAEPPTDALYSETSDAGGGADEPLVLLHGWGMNLRVFDGLRAELAAQHRVTAIDLPGHGRSAWTAHASPQQQLAQLSAVLPHGATLVGWSLGGQFALQLAGDPALAVRRVVLIASSPRFVRADDWPHGLPAATLERFAAQLGRDAGQTIADFLELQVRGIQAAERTAGPRRGAPRRAGGGTGTARTAGFARAGAAHRCAGAADRGTI